VFGFAYLKTAPTTYVLHFKSGKVKRAGAGLSFVYFRPTSTIALVPIASADVPFVFNEITRDFQEVTIQGQLTFRVTAPDKLAGLLDFTVNDRGAYKSEDPTKLEERLVHATQILAQAVIGKLSLREALTSGERLVAELAAKLREVEQVAMLGIDVLGVAILTIRPTPEMARALEAEAREQLQREADESIYARRNAAVEQERIIKESELDTDLAVAAKEREIRERKMAADVAVEEARAALIAKQVENDKLAADSRRYTIEATLQPFEKADWKTLMAISPGGGDPRMNVALAFRELAENASKIGELNMSPDLLKSLMGKG
jgi:regulator of protease activity HflC (stomatin/prohibitin superfamily)